MPILEEKKIEKKDRFKTGKVVSFNNYLDDYFGLIVLVSVLVLFVCSFFFVVFPRFKEAKASIKSAEELLNKEESHILSYMDRIKSYIGDYDGIEEEDKLKVNDMIAPKELYPSLYHTDLMIMLTDLFENNGYNISDLSVSQSTKREVATTNKKIRSRATTDSISSLPPGVFAVNVKAGFEDMSYKELKELLILLESRQRLIDVVDVNFDDMTQTVELGLTTYSFIHEDSK